MIHPVRFCEGRYGYVLGKAIDPVDEDFTADDVRIKCVTRFDIKLPLSGSMSPVTATWPWVF